MFFDLLRWGGPSAKSRATIRHSAAGLAAATLVAAALVCGQAVDAAAVSPQASSEATDNLGGLGLHAGSDNDETLSPYLSFGKWLGRPVQYRVVFNDDSSWQALANDYYIKASKKWVDSDPNRREVMTVGLLPTSDKGDFQSVIDGKHDAEFRAVAQSIKDNGIASRVIVRLGHEFNGDWYPWSAINDPKGYVGAFRRAVQQMRAVIPDLQIDWCANRGSSLDKNKKPFHWTDAYPGDDVVDTISMDVYDQYNSGWDDIVLGEAGLQELRDFAAAHDKKEAYPEWGCSTDKHGHGDDPEFIDHMADWFRAAPNGVVFQGYWNTWAGGPNAVLHGERAGRVPKAAAEYKRIFG